MGEEVNKHMNKLSLLAAVLIGMGQTACAHPHAYHTPYARRPVYSVSPYAYEYVPYYAPPAPVYYNNWTVYPRNRSYCVPPGASYGFSWSNGRSYGRVRIR